MIIIYSYILLKLKRTSHTAVGGGWCVVQAKSEIISKSLRFYLLFLEVCVPAPSKHHALSF
jgi:hypothetical protein